MVSRPRSAQTLDDRRSRGRGIHPLRKCNRFLRISTEQRLRGDIINKYCANCLATSIPKVYVAAETRAKSVGRTTTRCSICANLPVRVAGQFLRCDPRRRHHGLRSPNPTPSSRNHSRCSDQFEAPTAAPSVASLLQQRSVQIIPTVIVVLDTGRLDPTSALALQSVP